MPIGDGGNNLEPFKENDWADAFNSENTILGA